MYYEELDRLHDHTLMWVTIDRQVIPVGDLENDHVLNIERMLRGDGELEFGAAPALLWYPIILREMWRRKLKALPEHNPESWTHYAG